MANFRGLMTLLLCPKTVFGGELSTAEASGQRFSVHVFLDDR